MNPTRSPDFLGSARQRRAPQTGSFENPRALSAGTLRNERLLRSRSRAGTHRALGSLRPPCSTVSGPVGSSRDLPASSASSGSAVPPGPTQTECSADCHRHPSGRCAAPGDRNPRPPQAWTRPSAPPELHLRVFACPGPAHPGPAPSRPRPSTLPSLSSASAWPSSDVSHTGAHTLV